jgi:hypothetical protein
MQRKHCYLFLFRESCGTCVYTVQGKIWNLLKLIIVLQRTKLCKFYVMLSSCVFAQSCWVLLGVLGWSFILGLTVMCAHLHTTHTFPPPPLSSYLLPSRKCEFLSSSDAKGSDVTKTTIFQCIFIAKKKKKKSKKVYLVCLLMRPFIQACQFCFSNISCYYYNFR